MKTSPTFVRAARLPLALLKKAHRALIWVWLLPVRFYRRFLSPVKPGGGSCRFTPTCSQYALDAVREWGILCGTALAVWRVIRCNPFSEGGYDPVPSRADAAKRLRSRFSGASPSEPEKESPDNQQSPMER